MSNKVEAIKGFSRDWTCRGVQFEVGDTYRDESPVYEVATFPLDEFERSAPGTSRYAIVEAYGPFDSEEYEYQDTTFRASKLLVKKEISLAGLAARAVSYIRDRVNEEFSKSISGSYNTITNDIDRSMSEARSHHSVAVNTGARSAAECSGEWSVAVNLEGQGVAIAEKDNSASITTNDLSLSSSDGRRSVAASIGDSSLASSAGEQGAAIATGEGSAATSSGDYGVSVSTHTRSAATSSGYYSIAGSTGDSSTASATGKYSAAVNSAEYYGTAVASADRSAALSVGEFGTASAEGEDSIAIAAGVGSRAKAAAGSAIVCTYWEQGRLVHVRAGIAGRDGIEPDTWYTLSPDGEFVEVEVAA